MTLPPTNRIGDLVAGLLDRGYEQATAATLRSIAGSVSSGIVDQRLRELEVEAARLAEVGEPLKPDNPVLRALLVDMEPVLRRNGARIDVAAEDAGQVGANAAGQIVRQLALPGLSDSQLAAIGVRWNTPDPEAVNALVGYVNSDAWAAEIARYPKLVLSTVQNQAVRGLVEGWGPLHTAREIRRVAQGMTVAQANNLMRTTQLTSYRDAGVIHRVANEDILVEQIRIATLDSRTCMACIALHGQRLPIDARIDDHHQGRCDSIAVVRGRPRNVPTGQDYWDGLTEAEQRAHAGDSAFELMQSGRATLQDFVEPYNDPVFGEMVRQASVKGIVSRGV